MKDHSNCIRGFHHLAEAWYGKSTLAIVDDLDRVSIGFYHPDGSTSGEFEVVWIRLTRSVVPKLQVFDDGWSALHQFSDVLEKMAACDGQNITPTAFCELLKGCGIVDMTAHRAC